MTASIVRCRWATAGTSATSCRSMPVYCEPWPGNKNTMRVSGLACAIEDALLLEHGLRAGLSSCLTAVARRVLERGRRCRPRLPAETGRPRRNDAGWKRQRPEHRPAPLRRLSQAWRDQRRQIGRSARLLTRAPVARCRQRARRGPAARLEGVWRSPSHGAARGRARRVEARRPASPQPSARNPSEAAWPGNSRYAAAWESRRASSSPRPRWR